LTPEVEVEVDGGVDGYVALNLNARGNVEVKPSR